MKRIPTTILLCLLCSLLMPDSSFGQEVLVAREDELRVQGQGFWIIYPGDLTANDDLIPGDSVQVELVGLPDHGTIEIQEDGAFKFIPEVGFQGSPVFQYRLRTLPLQVLEFGSGDSNLTFDATVELVDLNNSSDSDTEIIPVTGSVSIDIGPNVPGFSSLRILNLDVHNESGHSLRFEYGLGDLRIIADPGSINLSLSEPGPFVSVAGFLNSFEQKDNVLGVDAIVTLEGTGLLNGQVPTDPQTLSTQTSIDLTGFLAMQSSGDMALQLQVDVAYEFELDGNPVDLAISGFMNATGHATERQFSNVAQVTLIPESGTGLESDCICPADVTFSVYPNPVGPRGKILVDGPNGEWVTIHIIDLLGRVEQLVWQGWMASTPVSLDLDTSGLPPGLRIVRVTTGAGSSSQSLVVL